MDFIVIIGILEDKNSTIKIWRTKIVQLRYPVVKSVVKPKMYIYINININL